ncbi:hypothetical protein OIU79_000134 [Salix purpurea]|uniref:Uncharacterized protein n=1 Tax=Salix purpurea TaxID=77065 RepID=A0A9Q0V0J8_SALPP|nr:hypothetical protein OIU79_000134 [Salix purpurea]
MEKRVDQEHDPPQGKIFSSLACSFTFGSAHKSFVFIWSRKLHRGRATYSTDNDSSSNSSDKVLESEMALHFLVGKCRMKPIPNLLILFVTKI